MAHIVRLKIHSDKRGNLIAIENILPFRISRIFYIYSMKFSRAGHRHKKNKQALICLVGSCEVYTNNGHQEKTYLLNSPDDCLVLNPEDWHRIDKPSPDAILISFSSHKYDIKDYIDEPYTK